MRYESPKNIKLYIADSTGKHSIMVLNVAKGYELGDVSFDDAFAYQRTLLPPAEISISAGSGSIMSGRVQYAYRLYSKNKPATPLSILSSVLSLYRNEYSGYEAEKKSGRAVDIKLPEGINTNGMDFIQVYRISYSVSGQLPKVSLVKDEKITSNIVDIGTDIMEMGMSEFLTMFTPFIYPKILESKGDYLFAANMKYSQDEVDAQFKDFDARAYNYKVSYSYEDTPVSNPLVIAHLENVDMQYLTNAAFEPGKTPVYNAEHWKKFPVWKNDQTYSYDVNGYGKYICWKYDYKKIDKTKFTSNDQTAAGTNTKSTFRRGEVYRFGVRLYDQYGRASSVKWIADIMIPTDTNIMYNIGIEFFKNPDSTWPSNIYGWEIVRCERTLTDRKTITQGIVGAPQELYTYNDEKFASKKREAWMAAKDAATTTSTNFICNPGFFSVDFFATATQKKFSIPSTDTLMFASPENCYQDDDINDILKANNSGLSMEGVYKVYPNSSIGNV